MWLKHPASVVIDSATYLPTISSPIDIDIDNIVMNLYDIIVYSLVECFVMYKDPICVCVWGGGGSVCVTGLAHCLLCYIHVAQ